MSLDLSTLMFPWFKLVAPNSCEYIDQTYLYKKNAFNLTFIYFIYEISKGPKSETSLLHNFDSDYNCPWQSGNRLERFRPINSWPWSQDTWSSVHSVDYCRRQGIFTLCCNDQKIWDIQCRHSLPASGWSFHQNDRIEIIVNLIYPLINGAISKKLFEKPHSIRGTSHPSSSFSYEALSNTIQSSSATLSINFDFTYAPDTTYYNLN